ncbi:bifunctional 3-(3-hydroxy-phenyl)propionate/3-hydroxycinnamic acid hydroxylase [Microvirga aerophila]|uniref:FAD-binding monooxygenase n=1 Tax=Microvirga aerophila TaxID=670291 RepID=A0A512BZE6_9HYPH|nr:bifunctional 3-(3-hydroxy-phenyl)propionate/3-hydroxycinnamic acid hydroxylase [Microvirga aerophila]GEO17197.1 FAD-binding monooxygenase [Microvirga aerophila]
MTSSSRETSVARENDPVLSSDQHTSYDVVVVGLGPVGAAAAQLLAREGLTVLAVDPSRQPYDKPRAIGIDHEALRLLQKLSITDELSLYMGPYKTSEYRSAAGQVLRRIVPQPEPHPLSWPPYSTFIQPELERLLRGSFDRWPTLDVTLGSRVLTVEQNPDEASVTIEDVDTGTKRLVTCRYVVGCDGAWSPVREAMGLQLEDLKFDEPWLVVDVLVNETADLPDAIIQYCDPVRPCTYVRGPADLRRWEIMLLPDENPTDMVDEKVIWSLLARWMTPDQGRIWRAATYRFHALVGKQWQRGRVFIAGDAAHQTPPFMAQGLNQGLRDVANLCWKIGEVLKHGADPALLKTYDEERRPNARAVIELTKTFGQVICEREPGAAAERDKRLLEEMQAGRGEIVRQDLLPPLVGGLLLKDATGGHAPGTGTVFPQPLVITSEGERRMDDVIDARFLLVAETGWAPTAPDRVLADRLGVTLACVAEAPVDGIVTLADTSGLIESWMSRNGVKAVLVRPDHVVFGSVRAAADVSGLLGALEHALRNPDRTKTEAGPDQMSEVH